MVAPQALAAPEELAPGVSCDGFVCTDDIYRIVSGTQHDFAVVDNEVSSGSAG